jgi:hypothetical protein
MAGSPDQFENSNQEPAGEDTSSMNSMLGRIFSTLRKANDYLEPVEVSHSGGEDDRPAGSPVQPDESQPNIVEESLDSEAPAENTIQQVMIAEAPISKILTVNGKNAKTLDFSRDINDPDVQLFGMGTVRLSTLKKEIKRDFVRFAEMVGNKSAKELLVYLTDFEGKYSSGAYFAYRMQALMEVEEYMKSPAVKRKITMMKRG